MDTVFATVNNRRVVHIAPEGNRHARCGRIVTETVSGPDLGAAMSRGTLSLCKTCVRVKAPRDLGPVVDMGELTDVWIMTDEFGDEIGRLHAETGREAASTALRMTGGDVSVRRLRSVPLGQDGRTWDVLAANTHRLLTRVFADDLWGALNEARKVLPYTDPENIFLNRV